MIQNYLFDIKEDNRNIERDIINETPNFYFNNNESTDEKSTAFNNNNLAIKNNVFTNTQSICRKLNFSDSINSENSENSNSNLEIPKTDFMEIENEENDLRLITKKSAHSLSFVHSKFDEDYIIIKTLSSGENGTTFLCMNSKDKKTYVVKRCECSKNEYYKLEELSRTILNNCDNIFYFYINQYNDCWIEESFDGKNNHKQMYVVSNYCCFGNLVDFISKIKQNTDINIIDFYWDIIFEMIASIQFFHTIGYIHLDVKPTNYLVNQKGELIINDFSLSIKENEISSKNFDSDGDSIYISPELFYKNFDLINHKTDIFSLGLSIFEVLTNFNLPKNGEIWQKIRKEGLPNELKSLIKFDVENNIQFNNLILNMTNVNSELRPELIDVLNDEKNYPKLYERYKLIQDNCFLESYSKAIQGIKCEKYDFASKDFNLKDIFVKKSDSVKNIKVI